MLEPMGTVIPREILKMNVRYQPRRALASRSSLPPLSSCTPCNGLAPLPSLFPPPQAQLSASFIPAKCFLFGCHRAAGCILVVSDLHLFHLRSFSCMHICLPSPCWERHSSLTARKQASRLWMSGWCLDEGKSRHGGTRSPDLPAFPPDPRPRG